MAPRGYRISQATSTSGAKQIGLVFLNNRVRTRVYPHEPMDTFVKRVRLRGILI